MRLLVLAALALASCSQQRPDHWRPLVCTGSSEVIADDDPALELFREAEPDSLEARKVALAMARVNACD